MGTRGDALSFSLALGISLALHGAFMASLPLGDSRGRPPSQDVVVVDLVAPSPTPLAPDSPESAATQRRDGETASGSSRETRTDRAGDGSEDEKPSEPAAATPRQPSAPSPPPPPSAPLKAAGAETSTPPALRIAPGAELRTAQPRTPPDLARRRSPALRDLLPGAGELASYRQPKALPDPSAPGSREAVVVGLSEQDPRYQGYVDQVKAAIYGAWHTGLGLLVAGPSRSCLVRFSLNPLGLPGDVQILKESGNPSLDADAVDAVKRARIAPFPTQWTIERLRMEAQFDYEVR